MDAVAPPLTSIVPVAPFSFDVALAFLKRFPPTLGERMVEDRAVLGAARLDGKTVGFRVWADGGTVASGGQGGMLAFDMAPTDGVSVDAGTLAALRERLAAWLGAADDLGPFYALAEQDPPFAPVLRQLYGYHQVRFFTPFENACWAILGQRTPMLVARAAKHGLMMRFGGTALVDGHTLLAFPEPADLAAASRSELAELVRSERKAEWLQRIAQAFEATGPAVLDAMPTPELVAWLQSLPGIGPWSATFVTLRGFGRADAPLFLGVAPTFDRKLLDAARRVYGLSLTHDALAGIMQQYAGWQGIWAHYLRVAT